jgi:hypothetical protein
MCSKSPLTTKQKSRGDLRAVLCMAGVDLNELQMSFQAKREDLARRGVPKWKQELVRGSKAGCASGAGVASSVCVCRPRSPC